MLEYDYINHPDHYQQHSSGIECWEFITWFPAMLAMSIKHLWREGDKPGVLATDDLCRALKYIELEQERWRRWPDLVDYSMHLVSDISIELITDDFPEYSAKSIRTLYDAVFCETDQNKQRGDLALAAQYLRNEINHRKPKLLKDPESYCG